MSNKLQKHCLHCKKPFIIKKYQLQKFCSVKCWLSSKEYSQSRKTGIIKKCLCCNKSFYVRKSIASQKYCSLSCFGKINMQVSGYKIFTEIRNKKISEALKGCKNYQWKNGIKKINSLIRKSREYKIWRDKIFKRDNYTCQACKIRSGNGKAVYLEAHHKISFASYPELRFDINNGITLCRDCHKIINKQQMKGNRNGIKKQQIMDFQEVAK